MKSFRKLFSGAKKAAPSLPAGERVYAIGDIHGRLDLFERLIQAIEEDDQQGDSANTTVILLGDLVDRGPHSRGVIDRAITWQGERNVRCLMGNHEEMFLTSLDEEKALRHFIRVGGKETILSYGLDYPKYQQATVSELLEMVQEIVPQEHRDYLESMEDMIEMGDYVFVHAGIHPERPLDEQRAEDLRWIRNRFLDHRGKFERIVVHGHTIFDDIVEADNRIGIDTGAYKSGRLSALVLERDQRRYVQAVEGKKGKFTIEHKDNQP